MSGRNKPKKPKGQGKSHKAPPPASPKPPVMLRVPCLPGVITPALAPQLIASPSVPKPIDQLLPQVPATGENDNDDIYMGFPSPQQQLIDDLWETQMQTQAGSCTKEEVSAAETNQATLHPHHVKVTEKALSVASSGKRKAGTHPSDHASSVNPDGSDHNAGTGSDLDLSIALVPQAPRKKAQKTSNEPLDTLESDDELDKPVAKGKQRKKASKKGQGVDSDDEDEDDRSYRNTFVLIVPQAGGSARCVKLESLARYHEALELIYENIGCSDVAKKPELSYKLSTATAKAVAISLSSEKDWKGFQKEVISQQKAKKRSIPVNILVPDRVCTITSI